MDQIVVVLGTTSWQWGQYLSLSLDDSNSEVADS